jgi:hypothetical protein
MRFTGVLVCFIILSSCGTHDAPGPAAASGLGPSPAAAAYIPRIGVGVTTGSRTCIAIKNANLTIGSPVTLVSAIAPQTFSQAEIASVSGSACPITKDVDAGVSNYDIHLPQAASLPKLTPLIAVVGTSAPFSTRDGNSVVADLDQNGKFESFRACSAGDGIHATVWSGNPLDGTMLWHGYYYEPGNSAAGPACAPKEMIAQ